MCSRSTPPVSDALARIAAETDTNDPVNALWAAVRAAGYSTRLKDIGLREDQLEEAARLIEAVVPTDQPGPGPGPALRVAEAWAGTT
jgi:hypothetical protein